jgi:hypothetical protein
MISHRGPGQIWVDLVWVRGASFREMSSIVSCAIGSVVLQARLHCEVHQYSIDLPKNRYHVWALDINAVIASFDALIRVFRCRTESY